MLNKKYESEEINNSAAEESVTMHTCVLLIKHVGSYLANLASVHFDRSTCIINLLAK